ncbi:MAG: 23S rRNA (adenine(1618)-N(6))-methyltransferase RlmF [Bacteroidota bacterium]
MLPEKRVHPKIKSGLHPRNRHRERYDFRQLAESCPELAQFVKINAYEDESIDFFNPEAVRVLNKALLKYYYDIEKWNIPSGYLCPPIPGRADYIHHMAEVLGSCNKGKIPFGNQVRCLDVGVGANCIYPVIGNKEYGWSFVGADIDPVALDSARKIVEQNQVLDGKVELRLQQNAKDIFCGIIQNDDFFDLSVCNPPFHASPAEAQSSASRKLNNLKRKTIATPVLNFGGQNNELWCEGGEEKFVGDMIRQSKQFSDSCFWFSSSVSKESSLRSIYAELMKVEALEVKTISMSQGNKTGRIVAWTFLSPEQQGKWVKNKWS